MDYKLAEIVDIPALQLLMEKLWEAARIPTGIIDIDGTILVATGWQQICTRFHRGDPQMSERCRESDAFMKKRLSEGNPLPECGYIEYRCGNGMVDIAIPIIIDDRHLANIFLGQFFYEPPDEGYFRRQATQFGINVDDYIEALHSVPIFSPERVRKILDFNVKLVRLLSRMGVEKLRQIEAQEKLRESENMFRTFFEASNDAFYILEPGGRLLETNQQTCDQLGYSRQEILRKSMPELLSADRAANFSNRVQEIRNLGHLIFKSIHLRKDGTTFPAEISVRPFRYRGKEALFGSFRNISSRERAEEALRENERKLSTLMANLPGIAYRCKIDRDWTMEFISQGCQLLTGHPQSDLIGNAKRSYGDLIHPDDRETVWQNIQDKLPRNDPFQLEYRIITATGDVRWVWEQGRGVPGPEGAIEALEGFITDITERKQAAEDLAYREQLEALIAGISGRFVQLSMTEAHRGIDPALKELGEFARMDRCYIFQFCDDMTVLFNSHEWCAPGVKEQIGNLQSIPVAELPWFIDQIQNNDIVYIPQVEKLHAAAAAEKEHWLAQDIRSVVTVPMHAGGALIGFLGFDAVQMERPLNEQDFSLLKTAASTIASAIEGQQAAKKLLASEERLSLALQVSNEGVWDWNLRSDQIYFSPRFFTMLGYQPGELPETLDTWTRLIHPADREEAVARGKKYLEKHQEKRFKSEYRMTTRDGGIVHILCRAEAVEFDDTGKPTRMVGTHMDITESKRAQENRIKALQDTEEALEKIDVILKSVADGLVVADLNNRVVLINKAAENLAGVTIGNPLGRQIGEVFNEEGLSKQLLAALIGEKEPTPLEWKVSEPGSLVVQTIQARTSVVTTKDGKKSGTITTLRDVTRERELDQMKSEFISTAAHELRTPLTTVLGYAELLLNKDEYGVTDPRLQQELLEAIVHKAGRLETIISELLDLSRIQTGQTISLDKTNVDIRRILEQVVAEYRGVAPAYRFTEAYPAQRVEIAADPNKIEQVMENLLSNAIKFSPKGSTIKIIGGVDKERYNVQVTDEGRGMTREQVKRVFDKFYRADASDTAKEGLGLGMSIAREIVEAHGGEIHVNSAPGRGTCITFALPLNPREPHR